MRIGVLLAAGRGERMGAGRNKAFIELNGRPLLSYSVSTFRECCDKLVIVAAAEELELAAELADGCHVIAGGPTRHESEWAALCELRPMARNDDIVAIHDVARPLVQIPDVQAVFDAAAKFGAAMLAEPASVPALEMEDHTSPNSRRSSTLVLRILAAELVWRAQTPQAATFRSLLDAYERAAAEGFTGTDTAAVLVRYGYAGKVVSATGHNPKITVTADLRLAESLLAAWAAPPRLRSAPARSAAARMPKRPRSP